MVVGLLSTLFVLQLSLKSCVGLPRALTHRRGETKEGKYRPRRSEAAREDPTQRPRRCACRQRARGPSALDLRPSPTTPQHWLRALCTSNPLARSSAWLTDSLTEWLTDCHGLGHLFRHRALSLCLWIGYSVWISTCLLFYYVCLSETVLCLIISDINITFVWLLICLSVCGSVSEPILLLCLFHFSTYLLDHIFVCLFYHTQTLFFFCLVFSFFIKLKLAYGIRLISPVISTVVRGARGSTLMVHRQIKPIVESQEVNYLGNHSINEITKWLWLFSSANDLLYPISSNDSFLKGEYLYQTNNEALPPFLCAPILLL